METMTEEQVQLEAVTPALKACPLFQALKEEHYSQILKIAETVRFAAEEEIVEEGSAADAFYVILDARRLGKEGQDKPGAPEPLEIESLS